MKTNGTYTVSEKIKDKLNELFFAGYCDDKKTAETIKKCYEKYGYLCDTHTAVGYSVMEEFKKNADNGLKTVVLSTASPYKFSKSVLSALGENTDRDEFKIMRELNKLTGVSIPKNLESLENEKVLHTDVIEKGEMLDYVLKKVAE